jgi:hypothetical protein
MKTEDFEKAEQILKELGGLKKIHTGLISKNEPMRIKVYIRDQYSSSVSIHSNWLENKLKEEHQVNIQTLLIAQIAEKISSLEEEFEDL